MTGTTDTICLPLKEILGLQNRILFRTTLGTYPLYKSLYFSQPASSESLVFWPVTYITPWRGIEKMKFYNLRSNGALSFFFFKSISILQFFSKTT